MCGKEVFSRLAWERREIEKKDEESEHDLVEWVEMFGKKAPVRFSRCCTPKYGDPIMGFKTSDGRIALHTKDCVHIESFDKNKSVAVKWKEKEEKGEVKLSVVVLDRVGLLAEILNILARSRININSVYTRSKKARVVITLKIELPSGLDINQVIVNIRSVKDVLDVKSG